MAVAHPDEETADPASLSPDLAIPWLDPGGVGVLAAEEAAVRRRDKGGDAGASRQRRRRRIASGGGGDDATTTMLARLLVAACRGGEMCAGDGARVAGGERWLQHRRP